MKIHLGTVVKWSFIISLISSIAGGYLKITHVSGGEPFLVVGVIGTMVFIVSAIYEVRTSKKINPTEKMMWTIAFLFFSGIAGLIYFLLGRKRIISQS